MTKQFIDDECVLSKGIQKLDRQSIRRTHTPHSSRSVIFTDITAVVQFRQNLNRTATFPADVEVCGTLIEEEERD